MIDPVPDFKKRRKKIKALMLESPGYWQDLPIVRFLPCESQAPLKQGHISAGYFGLICKSMVQVE